MKNFLFVAPTAALINAARAAHEASNDAKIVTTNAANSCSDFQLFLEGLLLIAVVLITFRILHKIFLE